MNQIKRLEDAAMVIVGDTIEEIGSTEDIIKKYGNKADEIVDLSGHAVIPGFIDSHTHFIFGGFRPEEFMMRLNGASYLEIHKMGGGIQKTVDTTRNESEAELIRLGCERIKDMISMGVTTVESKSGYGLDHDCELRQLRINRYLEEKMPITVISTYLGAHSIPKEYERNSDKYIDYIIEKMLPEIKEEHLAEFVDIFCEDGVFDLEQSKRLLLAAKKMGFHTKIHADEIISMGGGELAAKVGATSADHLLMISDQGIKDIAESDTVATLLPCTAFCLNKPYAPARKMIDNGCAVALASDYNPGSCFTNSIPLLFSLATIHMNMTLEETICALTLNGAAALNKANEIGSLEKGKKADFVVLDYDKAEYLIYHTCKNIVNAVIKNGECILKK